MEKLERKEKKKKRKEKKEKRRENKNDRKTSKENKKKENKKNENKKKRKGKKKKEKEKKHHKSAPHKKDRSSLFRSGNRNSVIGFNQDEVISTPEEYSCEDETYDEEYSVEEYSSKEKHEEPDVPGLEGKGLKVEEGQKLTQKQLQMLETIAEEKLEDSTNPLCKDPNQLFRSLT